MNDILLKDVTVGAIGIGASNARQYRKHKEVDPDGFRVVANYMREKYGLTEKTEIDFALGCVIGMSLMNANQSLRQRTQNGKTYAQ